MAGEASQSWQKTRRSKGTSYMAAGKILCTEELPFIKPSDLMSLIHSHENSTGKTWPVIQLLPTRFLSQHLGIRDEIWVGKQPNHIIPLLALLNLLSSYFKTNHIFPTAPQSLYSFRNYSKFHSPMSHLK